MEGRMKIADLQWVWNLGVYMPKRACILSFVCLISLPDPAAADTSEMDCGWARFRLVDPWLAEPELKILYEFDVDYYNFGCETLMVRNDVVSCSNIHEASYRMDGTLIEKTESAIFAPRNGEQVELGGEDYYVIEKLIDGQWQQYPLSKVDGLSENPYKTARDFDLTGNWQLIREYNYSFNFELRRLSLKTSTQIVQDNQVINQTHEASTSSCEAVN